MKALLGFVMLFATLSLTSVAEARPGDGRGGGRGGQVTCRAYDAGWEEHGGAHASCQDCLSRHGRCVEQCATQYYQCTATGFDRAGNRFNFQGSDRQQWQASQQAINNCYRSGYRNCQSTGCQTQSEVVSRRRCN